MENTSNETSFEKLQPDTKMQILLTSFNFLMVFLSVACLVIYLIKFFRSNRPTQTLATRNLTMYCVYLLIIYFVSYVAEPFVGLDFLRYQKIVDVFMRILLPYSLFIMAFDACLCLRSNVVDFKASSSSLEPNNRKFLIYRLSEISFSLLIAIFVEYSPFSEGIIVVKEVVILSIGFLCIIFYIAAECYVNMAKINRLSLPFEFSLYLRVLMAIGIISIFRNTLLGIRLVLILRNGISSQLLNYLVELSLNAEGLLIGVIFIFKKDIFQRKLDQSTVPINSA